MVEVQPVKGRRAVVQIHASDKNDLLKIRKAPMLAGIEILLLAVIALQVQHLTAKAKQVPARVRCSKR
jgi:hypothetical protein